MTRFFLAALLTPGLFAQAMVESAILSGHSAAAASKAGATTANALSKALGAATGTLGAAAQSAQSVPLTVPQAGSAQATKGLPAAPAVVRAEEKKALPDVALLKIGMERADLEKVAGKPSQMLSMPEDGKLIEKYKYWADGKELRLVLEDGKLTEIKP